jgi:hypothetical protein
MTTKLAHGLNNHRGPAETHKSIALITLDAPTISDDPMGQRLHISFFLVKTLETNRVQTAINTLHSEQSRTAHVQTAINAMFIVSGLSVVLILLVA